MSKNIISYATYTATGTTGGIINSQTPSSIDELAEVAQGVTTVKTQDMAWLTETFPEAVADGSIAIVNGSIYIEGLSLTGIISLVVACLSLLILIVKGVLDLKLIVDSNKLNAKEQEILQLKKELLEKEKQELGE